MIRKIIALTLMAFFFLVAPVFAGVQFIYPKFQGFDNNGNPLSWGLLYTYAANSSTAKATYSDKGLTAANANPVVLNSRGEAVVYGTGQYKFILRDSAGSLIWTFDFLDGIGGYLGGNFYFPDAGQADQGIAVESVTVKDFVDAIGVTKTATIVFSRGSTGNTTDYTFLTSETIPSNITCQFEQGARVSIAITKTLTLPSPANIIAQPNQQIKTGSGILTFSTGAGRIYPGWWGVVSGGAAVTNATALAESITAAEVNDSIWHLPAGTYAYNGVGLTLTGDGIVEGEGFSSILDYQGNGVAVTMDPTLPPGTGPPYEGALIRDLAINTTAGTPTGGLYLSPVTSKIVNVDHVMVHGFSQVNAYGIKIGKVVSCKVTNSNFQSNYYGAQVGEATLYYLPTSTTFSNCRFRQNAKHGVNANSGVGITFTDNCVIESNFGSGIVLTGNDSNTPGLGNTKIVRNHFENNGRSGAVGGPYYDIVILGFDAGAPLSYNLIADNFFGAGPAGYDAGNGSIKYSNIWYTNFRDNYFSVVAPAATDVSVGGNNRFVDWWHNIILDVSAVTKDGTNTFISGSLTGKVNLQLGAGTVYSTHVLSGSFAVDACAANGATNYDIAVLTEDPASAGALGGGIVLVTGWDGGRTRHFVDLVSFTYAAVAVINTHSVGGADARTYSLSGNLTLQMKLANSGLTYRVRVSQLTH